MHLVSELGQKSEMRFDARLARVPRSPSLRGIFYVEKLK
jgi:hypothetical protein